MHHKVSRVWRVLLPAAIIVAALAIPSTASAHFRSHDWYEPPAGGDWTCAKAMWLGVKHMGNFEGGVNRVGNCLGGAFGPGWEEQKFGWRANNGSLMATTVRVYHCFCNPMYHVQQDSHQ